MEILNIAVLGSPRTVLLRSVSTSTQVVTANYISTLTIPNTSNDYTSANNVLAYRPNFYRNAGGNTAIVFINLKAAIPCYQANFLAPICRLFTSEENSFQYHNGKPFIQTSRIGNFFAIFGMRNVPYIATYEFGVTGCSTFDPACVTDFEVTLVCLLPPALNQCGI